MNTSRTFAVTYTTATGKESIMFVKAMNEKEAIQHAKNNCFTGSNFGKAKESNVPYDKPRVQGYQGSERMK